MLCIIWFVFLFITGAVIGSFLNVCIARLPMQKSILWPGSRCGHCLEPIRWQDNIPLLSYLLLGGRCRQCGTRFSARYFFVELFTGLSFAGLYYLVIIENVHGFKFLAAEHDNIVQWGAFPWNAVFLFAHHALLLCFLIVATVCDWQSREIPLSLTLPGAVVGLVCAVVLPWPWPESPRPLPVVGPFAPSVEEQWRFNSQVAFQGEYPWPVWGPLPEFLAPGDNWQTGLATGLAGLLAGTWMLRIIRFLFSKGLGVEEAMGLGDADIMMMAGCFIGWQPVVVGFFAAIFPALVIALVEWMRTGETVVAFGPSLAIGVMVTWLCWSEVGPRSAADVL